jgi:hypothetical protein
MHIIRSEAPSRITSIHLTAPAPAVDERAPTNLLFFALPLLECPVRVPVRVAARGSSHPFSERSFPFLRAYDCDATGLLTSHHHVSCLKQSTYIDRLIRPNKDRSRPRGYFQVSVDYLDVITTGMTKHARQRNKNNNRHTITQTHSTETTIKTTF